MLAALNRKLFARRFEVILVLLAVSLLLWAWRTWSEPRYLGRGIQSWIEQLPYDTASNSEAQEAMRFFDTRAVPYLIQAMERPQKWERGWLAKIPRRYLDWVIDLSLQQQVGGAAIGRLEELAREEIERNEPELNPHYPVLDRLLPLWKHRLQYDHSGQMLGALGNFGSRATNVAQELSLILPRMKPGDYEWFQTLRLLAETRDPRLTPLFLSYIEPTRPDPILVNIIYALGRNGHTNEAVAAVLRSGLGSTNLNLVRSAVFACGALNLCAEEALGRIKAIRDRAPYVGPHELQTCDIIEPILRWRTDTNNASAKRWIERNLAQETLPPIRLSTLDLLGRAGPEMKAFVPILSEIAKELWPTMRVEAVRALKSIDPEQARKVMQNLPPAAPTLRATTGNAKK